MTYSTQAKIAQDPQLRLRVAAALASEGYLGNPVSKAEDVMWRLAVTKGWDTAYEGAAASPSTLGRPGGREDVVTDKMIRQAVRDLLAAEAA